MLHIHFLQHWFNLIDLACEEVLYDGASLRRFASIDLGREAVSDTTSQLRFRHLLEQHQLGECLWGFAKVRYRCLTENACRVFPALALANICLAHHRLMVQMLP